MIVYIYFTSSQYIFRKHNFLRILTCSVFVSLFFSLIFTNMHSSFFENMRVDDDEEKEDIKEDVGEGEILSSDVSTIVVPPSLPELASNETCVYYYQISFEHIRFDS